MRFALLLKILANQTVIKLMRRHNIDLQIAFILIILIFGGWCGRIWFKSCFSFSRVHDLWFVPPFFNCFQHSLKLFFAPKFWMLDNQFSPQIWRKLISKCMRGWPMECMYSQVLWFATKRNNILNNTLEFYIEWNLGTESTFLFCRWKLSNVGQWF